MEAMNIWLGQTILKKALFSITHVIYIFILADVFLMCLRNGEKWDCKWKLKKCPWKLTYLAYAHAWICVIH